MGQIPLSPFQEEELVSRSAAAARVPSGQGWAAGKTEVKNRVCPCRPLGPLPWYLCYFPIDRP